MLSASKVFGGDGTSALVFPASRGRFKARVVAMDFYHACQMKTYKRGGANKTHKGNNKSNDDKHISTINTSVPAYAKRNCTFPAAKPLPTAKS